MSWSRRQFMLAGGAVAGAGIGLSARKFGTAATNNTLIRPPGALDEKSFLAACIRCGQCVTACPFESIEFAVGAEFGLANGTPIVNTRNVPCYLCGGYEGFKCIDACPTTALEPVTEISEIHMGVANIDDEICYAYNETLCRICLHMCPFPNRAIQLDERLRPVVDEEYCIGCGLCDYGCPTEPSSIPVRPRAASAASEPM